MQITIHRPPHILESKPYADAHIYRQTKYTEHNENTNVTETRNTHNKHIADTCKHVNTER